jgi:hypothetical protein
MITIRCACGETFHADEQHAGHRIRCATCGKLVEIVAPAQKIADVHPRSDSPSTGRSRTTRILVAAASLAGIIFVSWGVFRIVTPPERKTAPATVGAPFASLPAPVVAVQAAAPTCQTDVQVRPRSGTELGPRYRGGLGELRVVNGTELDAVPVLIDNRAEAPRRAIFIRKGESGAMMSVPAGRYRLRFHLGSDWLAERRFCYLLASSEFDDVFAFEEVQATAGTGYGVYSVTLQPVPEGTAHTHVVPDGRFELPPP